MLLFVYLSITLGAYLYFNTALLDFLKSTPGCLLYETTGLICPGCGGTRALNALFNGEIIKALSLNPFIALTPIYLYAGVFLVNLIIKDRSLYDVSFNPLYAWILLIALILFSILRNVPSPALDFLRPM